MVSASAIVGRQFSFRLGFRSRRKRPPGGATPPGNSSDTKRSLQCNRARRAKTLEARWKTWVRFHSEIFGSEQALPLTAEKLQRVTEKLRLAGFRSAKNYLSAAKKKHIAFTREWDAKLALDYAEAMRDASWNLGPSRWSRAYDLMKVVVGWSMGLGPISALVHGHLLAVIAALNLFRGGEVGAVNCEDIIMHMQQQWVSWMVCSSKTDTASKGFRFRWLCTCQLKPHEEMRRDNATTWMLCAFHATAAYAAMNHGVSLRSSDPQKVPGGTMPFFKMKKGGRVTPAAIAKFLNDYHEVWHINSNEFDDQPSRFGGHSPRRAGVQHHYRLQMAPSLIQRLARWKDRIITSYLGYADLAHLGSHMKADGTELPAANTLLEVTLVMKEMRKLFNEHRQMLAAEKRRKTMKPLATNESGLNFEEVALISMGPPRRHHMIQSMMGHCSLWRCKCGFKFGKSSVEIVLKKQITEAAACRRGCYKAAVNLE